MLYLFKKNYFGSFKPTLKFSKLFSLIFGISFIISTASFKFYLEYFKLFVLFQLFIIFISFLNYYGTFFLIKLLINRGLVSINLNDVESSEKVPEPGALLGCVLYILSVIFVQWIHRYLINKSLKLNPGLISIVLMTLLGLIDDILRLNWTSKIVGPILASLPLCLSYTFTNDKFISFIYLFTNNETYIQFFNCICVILFTVFCSNSINIYAGINGLEVGQSLVISFFILVYNSLEMYLNHYKYKGIKLDFVMEKGLYTFYLTIPFIAINISLLCFNWYPAKLFVGNIYTLFSGTFFSVVSILGDLWKIIPFLFIPQLLNFFLSLPQLIGIMDCPRHRVPKFDPKIKKLKYSNNLTVYGPMKEEELTLYLIIFQICCGIIGLIVKYFI